MAFGVGADRSGAQPREQVAFAVAGPLQPPPFPGSRFAAEDDRVGLVRDTAQFRIGDAVIADQIRHGLRHVPGGAVMSGLSGLFSNRDPSDTAFGGGRIGCDLREEDRRIGICRRIYGGQAAPVLDCAKRIGQLHGQPVDRFRQRLA